MSIPIRASSSSTSHIGNALNSLKKKVVTNCSEETPFLFGAIETLIDRHQSSLFKHLRLNHEDRTPIQHVLYDVLKERDVSDYFIKKKRMEMMKEKQMKAPIQIYSSFLKSLYWSDDSRTIEKRSKQDEISRLFYRKRRRYAMVNHEELYSNYCRLPKPSIAHIWHNHLNDFLEMLLVRRNFIRPKPIASNPSISSTILIHDFNEMLKSRQEQLKVCNTVFKDLKNAGLPLTRREQNSLVFMMFFKDRNNLYERSRDASIALSSDTKMNYEVQHYNDFNWEVYKNLKESSDERRSQDVYNYLLFHALRHKQLNVVKDILENLKLEFIWREDHHAGEINKANEMTIEILLDNISCLAESDASINLDHFVTSLMHILSQPHLTLDTRMINKIVRALLFLKKDKLAEDFVFSVFVPKTANIGDDELFVYLNYTFEDKRLYKELMNVYVNAKKITGDNTVGFRILPNESSFRSLLEYRCAQNDTEFSTINKYLEVIQNEFHLPITTRLFKTVFKKFGSISDSLNHSDWNLVNLTYVTSELVGTHEALYGIRSDSIISEQMKRYNVEPQILKAVSSFLDSRKTVKIPRYRGNFLKLSDDLMKLIYDAFISTIQRDPSLAEAEKQDLITKINNQRKDLSLHVNKIRSSSPRYYNGRINKENIYAVDEITYVKKGYLLDLLDSVCVH